MTQESTLKGERQFKGFLVDVTSLIGGQLVIAVLSFINSIVLARALGVEDRGYFVMAMLLPSMLITFSDIGLGQASTKFVAAKRWPASTVLTTNILVTGVRLLLIGVAGIVLIHFFSKALFPGVPPIYLYLGLFQTLALSIQGLTFPLLLGLGQGVKYSGILVASSALSLLGLSAGWVLVGLSVNLALIIQGFCSLSIAVYIFLAVRNAVGSVGQPSMAYLKDAWEFGSRIYISIVSNFANEKMILLLINFSGGAVYVSLYTIAQSLTERIYLLSDAVGTMLMPKIAEDPDHNSSTLTPITFKLTLALTALLCGVLIYSADIIIVWVYGTEFGPAAEIMRLLLVAVIFCSGWRVISQDLNARGLVGITAAINASVTIITLTLATGLLPVLGLKGAAMASLTAYAVALFAGLIFFLNTNPKVSWSVMLLLTQGERRAVAKLAKDFRWSLIKERR